MQIAKNTRMIQLCIEMNLYIQKRLANFRRSGGIKSDVPVRKKGTTK